jgi:hypothetical protein
MMNPNSHLLSISSSLRGNSLTIEPGPSLKDQRADVDTTESVRSASAIGGLPRHRSKVNHHTDHNHSQAEP